MPVVRLGLGDAPFSVLLPSLIASGVASAVQRGPLNFEAVAVRPTPLLFRATIVGVTLGVALIVTAIGGVPLATVTIRNLAGYLGAALLALRLVGGVAALVVAPASAVAASVLGSDDSIVWWVLHPASDWPSIAVASLLFLVGGWAGTSRTTMRARAVLD